ARMVLPPMPASNRSLAMAALDTHLRSRARAGSRDVEGALAAAHRAIATSNVTQRVLLLTERALGAAEVAEVARLTERGVQVATVLTRGAGDRAEREDAVRAAIPSAGMTTFRDVRLTFEGTPAPSHVIEASGGSALWRLDA